LNTDKFSGFLRIIPIYQVALSPGAGIISPMDAPDDNGLHFERLELALRASSEGIWDWQVGEEKIFYSRRVLEFLECGGHRAPNLFRAPHAGVYEEDQAAFARVVSQSLENSGPETLAIDARVTTGGGQPRWLRIRGTIVRDRKGDAIRIAGSMIDISLRKRAEAQVEDERFLLRQLIDHIPIQIYFKDLESRFVLGNQGMAEWADLENPDQLIGKHDRDLFDEEHWREADADEKKIIATQEPITGKLERETWRKGVATWVVSSKFPWKDRRGKVMGTFGVSNDVTELVLAKQEAVALAAELQTRNEGYEEELQLAREIQQALAGGGLPKIAANDGSTVDLSSRYIPISGLAGDFFEVIPISSSQAGLLICDVMGHGVRAALVVAMLRGLLEKQRSQATDPALFLRGLNDGLSSILERAGTTMFATAFYAVVDLEKDTLRFSCAGHPGPIGLGAEGVTQFNTHRSTKGPALGLIRGVVYPVNEMPMSSIDRLVMFTDGVLEAENQSGEPFFEKRLMEIIGSTAHEPLETMLDTILTSVLAFSEGKHFDDDVCLLAMELRKLPAAV
jgi:sigma-B regulation protein RsbU (phosphoserine phosphatase)